VSLLTVLAFLNLSTITLYEGTSSLHVFWKAGEGGKDRTMYGAASALNADELFSLFLDDDVTCSCTRLTIPSSCKTNQPNF
jgi:hypothetical protein